MPINHNEPKVFVTAFCAAVMALCAVCVGELLELVAGAAELKREARSGLLAITDDGIELKRDDKLELLELDVEEDAWPKRDDRLELLEAEEFEEKPENN
jgi:hypothetical protein